MDPVRYRVILTSNRVSGNNGNETGTEISEEKLQKQISRDPIEERARKGCSPLSKIQR
ncbi:hypothetical protein WN48_02625 [Eufriesea mexicana]|uniref:Uncharacterized protein n=1 Tax=Eufriesea mexicana TaxID=516756 RepID=A0A310SQI1_9HYME|nr:hypothetical protein WN48_02625 [Eufriesea mexicana]